MKNYVISLSKAHHRRMHIQKEFAKQGVCFEFFDAIRPEQVDDLACRHQIKLHTSALSAGEKACLMSHVVLWQNFLDGLDDYLSVFEDDVYLGKNAHEFLGQDDWLRENQLHFVKTETFGQERKLAKEGIALMNGRCVRQLKECHLGTAGYIISRQCAKSLLYYMQNLSVEDMTAIDNLMFHHYLLSAKALPIYQMLPALCVQEFILLPKQNQLPSTLKDERQQNKSKKPKRALSEKIKGELSNAMRKTFGKLLRTKINFQ